MTTTTQPTNTTTPAPLALRRTSISPQDAPRRRDEHGPRNQLGEPATKTPDETIARLKAKVSKNRGGANRERIQTQISKELAAEG